jgi:hypothetical protein
MMSRLHRTAGVCRIAVFAVAAGMLAVAMTEFCQTAHA